MATQRELFVQSVRMIRIEGQTVLPTIVYYQGRQALIGTDAIDTCLQPELLNENFKIELGTDDPVKLVQQRRVVGENIVRSPLGLAKDFLEAATDKAKLWIGRQGLELPNRVLVAEPISIMAGELPSNNWLTNYRSSVRRVLDPQFAEVDFMPEPFAVFQYYRYGVRHPLVAQKVKHIALVVDFGGGTFDVSVIETTADGDISQSGRNSRPLSAKCLPIGGFYINRIISEELLFDNLVKGVDKQNVRKLINRYLRISNIDSDEVRDLRSDNIDFIRNFKKMMQSVERAKIAICSNIANWDLNAELINPPAYPVRVPRSPFSPDPLWAEVRLDATRLRKIFENIWDQRLKSAVAEGIHKARQELTERSISLVLLSGGSSNIRWLKPLLERDLAQELQACETLELGENFQEIVAKGLAIECARRFYTEGEGDFRAVTYNRLCLALRPDDGEIEIRRLRPASDDIPDTDNTDGVLLASASSLNGLIDKPLRWKVRLTKPPRRHLDYYFMSSSFDPTVSESRHNIIDSRVLTPRDASFGAAIELELTVREDGTALPKFLYGKGGQRREVAVEARPFALDMTFASRRGTGSTYLGLDFGSSTSAFSYVHADEVKIYTNRSNQRAWLDLSELVQKLPYPAASPLARFIAETETERMDRWGRETIEGLLTVAAYACYSEFIAQPKNSAAIFKSIPHRSAGPLWAMLQTCLRAQSGALPGFEAYQSVLTEPIFSELNEAVTQVAATKHGKRAIGLDFPRIIRAFGNITVSAFGYKTLGRFEGVRTRAFGNGDFEGLFRVLKGPSEPFVEIYEYYGPRAFSPEEIYICDVDQGIALNLAPLMFWGVNRALNPRDTDDLCVFDTIRQRDHAFGYKAIEEREEIVVSADGLLKGIHGRLSSMRDHDIHVPPIKGLTFVARNLGGAVVS